MVFVSVNVCSPPFIGSSFSLSGNTPTAWTQFRFNFTATSSTPTLTFRFDAGLDDEYFLDDVSVTNVNTPGTQLLTNPNFESSSSTIVGWSVGCSSGCSNQADITSGSNCYLSSRCVIAQCDNSNETVSQSFATTIGNIYTVSFRLRLDASGPSAPTNRFYVDIY